ncbi:hypothetical protein RRF57_011968 [Xylaria bambusicola]|uniref:Uncharacterized protein n=1 Tax=Xylaria bambusicola TaxID=326684 RepID=A0AAN7V165_9PEZI
MPYIRTTFIFAVAAMLLRGVRGGEIDARIVQRAVNMGVSALQDDTVDLDTNLNDFQGSLFGAPPTPSVLMRVLWCPQITFSGDVKQPFRVGTENLILEAEGTSSTQNNMADYRTAVNIACDRFQNQDCKRAADKVPESDKNECDAQKDQCQDSLNNPPTPRTYRVRMSNDDNTDAICDIDIPEPF